MERYQVRFRCGFLLTPLREGRPPIVLALSRIGNDFYSRPCGRGDVTDAPYTYTETEFLLTPLREGRRGAHRYRRRAKKHFYSRPCGRGDPSAGSPYTTPGQFLLTPLREGRRSMINTKHVLSVFLLTPLREGRRPWGRRGSTQNGFLLTPLREGRHVCDLDARTGRIISTHAPAGGATICRTGTRGDSRNFYSRPCGRGDTIRRRVKLLDLISTHAPAGGATVVGTGLTLKATVISTHAPAGGATLFHVASSSGRPIFLLTPLREGRPQPVVTIYDEKKISTHAPAGGATRARILYIHAGTHFYSRPCGRGDISAMPNTRSSTTFLLTPLREGRLSPANKRERYRKMISTHAPAGGATKRSRSTRPAASFLLTPLREGRRL